MLCLHQTIPKKCLVISQIASQKRNSKINTVFDRFPVHRLLNCTNQRMSQKSGSKPRIIMKQKCKVFVNGYLYV